jgi:serralysin
VTLSGTFAAINAALASVAYTPAHDFFGADALTVTTDDGGNAGSGGALADVDQVAIKVGELATGSTANEDYEAPSGNQKIDAGGGDDAIRFNFKLTDATISYSGNTVVIDGPGSHTVLSGFETFRFTDGTVDNKDADPLVDDLFYYARHHDVWTAHLDADQHYHDIGWHQGFDPNAFFSTTIYLSANPDVQGLDPLLHFHQTGWAEGRVASPAFDTRLYLAANPDVAGVDPLAHFLQFGYQENRQPVAATELIATNGFDYVWYLNHNADVAAANVDPLAHFMTVGWTEGRNPNALFDVDGYLATYGDVAAAHVNPLTHYNTFGWHEGRDPSAGFDTTSYLAAYPDVEAAHINPLTHFLQFGIHEGRSPFADGVWG